jgi:hypothetical protein
MMRLIPVCLPLVLAPLIVAGQQRQPEASQKPDQASAVKQTSSRNAATRHRARHHSRKTATRKKITDATLCREDSQIAVDVIMGTQARHVCLDKARLAGEEAEPTPGQLKVEVINGPSTDMQYFSDKNQETAHNQPVVVGVESSDTRFAGGNRNPVVTAVTSSSSVDATSVSSGGQPVTKQVSPRPKRPAYEPDTH